MFVQIAVEDILEGFVKKVAECFCFWVKSDCCRKELELTKGLF